jgi:DNA-binding transcriptional MocR family regulator
MNRTNPLRIGRPTAKSRLGEAAQQAAPPGGPAVHRADAPLPVAPFSSLAEVLADWGTGEGPLWRQLAEKIGAGIRAGRLAGGSRLPPERKLAWQLGVARNTIARAYADLEAEGLVSRRQGSGTVVSSATAALTGQPAELSTVIQRNVISRLVAESIEDHVDFLGAHARLGSVVDETVREAIATLHSSEVVSQPGYFPLGYPPLRDAIAEHLTGLGLATTAEQILVTSGAQQAITLVAAGLVRGKRNVIIEDPTFPGAIDSFRMAGARLLTVPVTAHGIDLDRLSALLEDSEIALAYLMPTYHNPTGVLMSATARQELARLSEATGLILVEDDALAEISLTDAAPPPVAAMTRKGMVLTIGSLSKLFWGGLRIGWIRGPVDMVAHLGHVKAAADLGTSVLSQAVAIRLLERAPAARSVRRSENEESLERLESLLRRLLPIWSWHRPSGGLSLWAQLPYGSASELARFASRRGVAIVPGPVMSPRGSFDDHLRLPLGRDAATMTAGVERLAAAWADYAAERKHDEPLGVVI